MAIRKPKRGTAPPRPEKAKIKRSVSLDEEYDRFMKTEKGSEEYVRLGNRLMEKVFSGK
jgi:hypothetical protein